MRVSWLWYCALLVGSRAQEPISVKFVNSGYADLMLHWSKPDGELGQGMAVAPGGLVAQRTYSGHVWKVLKSGGPPTPLRTVVIEGRSGFAQTIDVATGDVRSDAPETVAAAAGGGEFSGDVVGLWR